MQSPTEPQPYTSDAINQDVAFVTNIISTMESQVGPLPVSRESLARLQAEALDTAGLREQVATLGAELAEARQEKESLQAPLSRHTTPLTPEAGREAERLAQHMADTEGGPGMELADRLLVARWAVELSTKRAGLAGLVERLASQYEQQGDEAERRGDAVEEAQMESMAGALRYFWNVYTGRAALSRAPIGLPSADDFVVRPGESYAQTGERVLAMIAASERTQAPDPTTSPGAVASGAPWCACFAEGVFRACEETPTPKEFCTDEGHVWEGDEEGPCRCGSTTRKRIMDALLEVLPLPTPDASSPGLSACIPVVAPRRHTIPLAEQEQLGARAAGTSPLRLALEGAYLELDKADGEERARWAQVLAGLEAALVESHEQQPERATVHPTVMRLSAARVRALAENGDAATAGEGRVLAVELVALRAASSLLYWLGMGHMHGEGVLGVAPAALHAYSHGHPLTARVVSAVAEEVLLRRPHQQSLEETVGMRPRLSVDDVAQHLMDALRAGLVGRHLLTDEVLPTWEAAGARLQGALRLAAAVLLQKLAPGSGHGQG